MRGYVVVFGAASGPVAPFALERLMATGSQYLTRPSLSDYVPTNGELLRRSAELFDWKSGGLLDVHIGGRYSLEDAPTAHSELEGRRTMGKLLILPK